MAAEKGLLTYFQKYPKDRAGYETDSLDLYESQGWTKKAIAYHRNRLETAFLTPAEHLMHEFAVVKLESAERGTVPARKLQEMAQYAELRPR